MAKEEAQRAKDEVERARAEAVKNYIDNFHDTTEYQSFSTYWRRFGYAKVVERVEELHPDLDTSALRTEFLAEAPQTPAEEAAATEVPPTLAEEVAATEVPPTPAEEVDKGTEAVEAPPVEALAPKAPQS